MSLVAGEEECGAPGEASQRLGSPSEGGRRHSTGIHLESDRPELLDAYAFETLALRRRRADNAATGRAFRGILALIGWQIGEPEAQQNPTGVVGFVVLGELGYAGGCIL